MRGHKGHKPTCAAARGRRGASSAPSGATSTSTDATASSSGATPFTRTTPSSFCVQLGTLPSSPITDVTPTSFRMAGRTPSSSPPSSQLDACRDDLLLKHEPVASSTIMLYSGETGLVVVLYPLDDDGVPVPVQNLWYHNEAHRFLDDISCFCEHVYGTACPVHLLKARMGEHVGCICLGCPDWMVGGQDQMGHPAGCRYWVNLDHLFTGASPWVRTPLQAYPECEGMYTSPFRHRSILRSPACTSQTSTGASGQGNAMPVFSSHAVRQPAGRLPFPSPPPSQTIPPSATSAQHTTLAPVPKTHTPCVKRKADYDPLNVIEISSNEEDAVLIAVHPQPVVRRPLFIAYERRISALFAASSSATKNSPPLQPTSSSLQRGRAPASVATSTSSISPSPTLRSTPPERPIYGFNTVKDTMRIRPTPTPAAMPEQPIYGFNTIEHACVHRTTTPERPIYGFNTVEDTTRVHPTPTPEHPTWGERAVAGRYN